MFKPIALVLFVLSSTAYGEDGPTVWKFSIPAPRPMNTQGGTPGTRPATGPATAWAAAGAFAGSDRILLPDGELSCEIQGSNGTLSGTLRFRKTADLPKDQASQETPFDILRRHSEALRLAPEQVARLSALESKEKGLDEKLVRKFEDFRKAGFDEKLRDELVLAFTRKWEDCQEIGMKAICTEILTKAQREALRKAGKKLYCGSSVNSSSNKPAKGLAGMLGGKVQTLTITYDMLTLDDILDSLKRDAADHGIALSWDEDLSDPVTEHSITSTIRGDWSAVVKDIAARLGLSVLEDPKGSFKISRKQP